MSQQASPPQLTLKQLFDGLTNSKVPANLEKTRSYLDPKIEGHGLLREGGDEGYIPKLLILASEALVLKGDLWTKEVPKGLKSNIQTVLEVIELIDNLSITPPITDEDFLLRLVTCTNPQDPWMTPTSSKITAKLCNRYSKRLTSPSFLIEQILTSTIRPLFSKSRPAAITPSARKAINPLTKRQNEPSDIDPATKPWKFESPGTLTLFAWAIEHADSTLLTANWPLFIPPLLTLLDDTTSSLRALASSLLSTLLSITPPKLLLQTGLGEVFEDAVMPTLLYLPSLTPADESILLLRPAYKVLFELADIRWSDAAEGLEKGQRNGEKLKFYDRIMRRGILAACLHMDTREDIQITNVLLGEMGTLISEMGIHTTRHLQALLPHLTSPLLSPFATTSPYLLHTTLLTTQLLIQNTWPRLSHQPHRNTLLNALCICWTHVCDTLAHEPSDMEELKNVKKELGIAGRLLVTAMSAGGEVEGGMDVDVREELRPILEVGKGEMGFEELFFGDS